MHFIIKIWNKNISQEEYDYAKSLEMYIILNLIQTAREVY